MFSYSFQKALFAHKSQIDWFEMMWVVFSRYMLMNSLKPLNYTSPSPSLDEHEYMVSINAQISSIFFAKQIHLLKIYTNLPECLFFKTLIVKWMDVEDWLGLSIKDHILRIYLYYCVVMFIYCYKLFLLGLLLLDICQLFYRLLAIVKIFQWNIYCMLFILYFDRWDRGMILYKWKDFLCRNFCSEYFL